MSIIDLNADLGEGIGNDALLMPYLTSCNIACGEHAGDTTTIEETIRLAIQSNVKVGAHPSFPDRENFGRIEMELPQNELEEILIDQIERIKEMAEEAGVPLHHIKPHGALYNMASVRNDIAEVIVSVMKKFPSVGLYAPFRSVVADLAIANGIKIFYEVFADRNYKEDLTLVSRKEENAMLYDPDAIATHVIRMIKNKKVKTVRGKLVSIEANTICIHGDNPKAVEIAKALRIKLTEAKIEIA